MINPFLQPPKKAVEEPAHSVIIDGSFVCMTCEEICDEALLFPVEKVLVWYCTDEHKSEIENFNLGV
jgi:hypothetical protein